ncbi:hypothetical protein PP707_06725 [Acetobacter pasteurianus]|nr:hypothetical protein [Acetobacter pasteurianus]
MARVHTHTPAHQHPHPHARTIWPVDFVCWLQNFTSIFLAGGDRTIYEQIYVVERINYNN